MHLHLVLGLLQALGSCYVCHAAMQHYPAWGHYDVCKSQVYTDEGLTWDYMACQPEAADMTKHLKVTLDPPNITCGDPPETYCALVSDVYPHAHTTAVVQYNTVQPHNSCCTVQHSTTTQQW